MLMESLPQGYTVVVSLCVVLLESGPTLTQVLSGIPRRRRAAGGLRRGGEEGSGSRRRAHDHRKLAAGVRR